MPASQSVNNAAISIRSQFNPFIEESIKISKSKIKHHMLERKKKKYEHRASRRGPGDGILAFFLHSCISLMKISVDLRILPHIRFNIHCDDKLYWKGGR